MKNKKTLMEIVLSVNVPEEGFEDEYTLDRLKALFEMLAEESDDEFDDVDESIEKIADEYIHLAYKAASEIGPILDCMNIKNAKQIVRYFENLNDIDPYSAMKSVELVLTCFSKESLAREIEDAYNITQETGYDFPSDFMDVFFETDEIDLYFIENCIDDAIARDEMTSLSNMKEEYHGKM